jgi:diaminopimelate decarboxylase
VFSLDLGFAGGYDFLSYYYLSSLLLLEKAERQMLLGTQRINEAGRLEIGGCDVVELVKRFGTPLYVMDEKCLRDACRAYRAAFESRYPKVLISFAGKAFINLAACRIADEEGLGLDVSSGGELNTALEAKFPAERILLHGNNKSAAELDMALGAGVGRIVVDSEWEVELLAERAKEAGKKAEVLLRVTPGIQADTHTYIQAGQVDTKFGLPMVGNRALLACQRAASLESISFHGIHCHIGSSIFDLVPFRQAAEVMVDFAARLKDAGIEVEDIDLGGGLGVRYRSEDKPPSIEEYAEALISSLTERLEGHGLSKPRLILEPGRSIVGEAGVTLYTVGVIKEIPGVRTYVSVDGGLADNPRVALYQARYEAIAANKANQPAAQQVTITGKHCESDVLIWDIDLPKLEPEDILAVQTTGAYNYSMASNYNRLPRPAVVLVGGGQAEVIVERETFSDLLRADRIPPRLKSVYYTQRPM